MKVMSVKSEDGKLVDILRVDLLKNASTGLKGVNQLIADARKSVKKGRSNAPKMKYDSLPPLDKEFFKLYLTKSNGNLIGRCVSDAAGEQINRGMHSFDAFLSLNPKDGTSTYNNWIPKDFMYDPVLTNACVMDRPLDPMTYEAGHNDEWLICFETYQNRCIEEKSDSSLSKKVLCSSKGR